MAHDRYIVFIVMAFGLVLAAGAATWLQAQDRPIIEPDQATATALSPAELKALIDRKAPVHIYDANVIDSYIEGHVPGAQWVEYDAVDAVVLPLSKDAMLVFYCYNPLCGASHTAAEQARALGYRNVWRMPEGIAGWRAARMPVVAGRMQD